VRGRGAKGGVGALPAWLVIGLVAIAVAWGAEPKDPYEVRDDSESVLAAEKATPPMLTLGTPFVRSATGWLLPASLVDNLPDFRVKLDASAPAAASSIGTLQSRVKGVEVLVPQTETLWLGWEMPEEEGDSPRATFSIRNTF
jgi:hypothetical protein